MMRAVVLHEQNGVPYHIAIIISVLLSDLLVEFHEVYPFKRKRELTKRRTHPESLDHQLLVVH